MANFLDVLNFRIFYKMQPKSVDEKSSVDPDQTDPGVTGTLQNETHLII